MYKFVFMYIFVRQPYLQFWNIFKRLGEKFLIHTSRLAYNNKIKKQSKNDRIWHNLHIYYVSNPTNNLE